MRICLDGWRIGAVTTGLNRTDVCDSIPDIKEQNTGFRYDLDFRSLSKGTHLLQLVVELNDGRSFVLDDRTVSVVYSAQASAVPET